MIHLPQLKQLRKEPELESFSTFYFQNSGLSIPDAYLKAASNRVFSIQLNGQMIGGYILGKGARLRTLEIFSSPSIREKLYQSLGDTSDYTEITCFWIKSSVRENTNINTFIWLSLAFSLLIHGAPQILFGTCSAPLARLYGVTSKSVRIHEDRMNGKRTFIFRSKRNVSLWGFLEIIRFKWKRTRRIKRKKLLRQLKLAA